VQVIRQWGISQKDINNEILIFVTTDQGVRNNVVRIVVGQGPEGNYSNGKLGRMLDEYMMPSLENGDYILAFTHVVEEIQAKEESE